MNQDGALNEADQEALANEILQLSTPRDLPLTTIRESSPARGEADVAVTRETILHFAHPLSPFTSLDTTRFHADFGGRKILSCVQLATDRKKVTLFYLEPLPSNARVIVTFEGNGLLDLIGRPIDANGDGQPGGIFTTEFETISTQPVPNTRVRGRVYASERGTGGAEVPLAGVTITVDGAEETLRSTTGADGCFTLNPCPAGTFFVHIDGRTSPASNYPNGNYYPSVGKKWIAVPGRMTNPEGAVDEPTPKNPDPCGSYIIYLPCICTGTLNTVSPVAETVIHFPPAVLAANPALAGTEIRVPANSLFADDGTRGGKVGIAPVAPDRLPSPLPPGLNPPMVFTVQSDGATNFDRPVPVCLPNLPDPVTGKKLEPGAKSALFSFNHDLGEWEIAGSATVSEDGNCVTTDAGVGIRQPGWHTIQPGVIIAVRCPPLPNQPLTARQVFDALSDIATCATRIAGVDINSAIQCASDSTRLVASFFTVQQQLRTLMNSGADSATVLAALNSLVALKESVVRAINSCAQAVQGSANKAKTALACAKALLFLAQQYCRSGPLVDPLGNQCEDPSSLAQKVCIGIEALIKLITGVEKSITAVENQFNESALVAFCAIADVVIYAAREYVASQNLRRNRRDGNGGQAYDEIFDELEKRRVDLIGALHIAQYSLSEGRIVARESSKLAALGSQIGGDDPGPFAYRFVLNGAVIRGLGRSAQPFRLIAPPDAVYRLDVVSLQDFRHGYIDALSSGNGETEAFTWPRLESSIGVDADNDGISDDAELILGFDPYSIDSDTDGLSDLFEITSDFAATSVNNSISGLAAQTKAATSAADVSASSRTLAVACGAEGTAFLATQGIAAPVIRTRVPTTSHSAAVSMGANAALVAESEAGFRCVSLDEQLNVTFMAQVPVAGRAVSAVASGGIGYGGTSNGTVLELDLASGGVLRQLETGAGDLEDLAVQGDWLFARKPDRLLAIPLNNPALAVAGQLVLSTGRTPSPNRLRIAVADGRVFCTRGNGVQIVNTASVPTLTLAGTVTGPGDDWRHFVPNGRVGVLAGKVASGGSASFPRPTSLFTIPVAGDTVSFATSFDAPGFARAVALNRGLAYVVCDNGTLAVVNYLDFDRNRVPPGITLSSSVNLAATPPQVEEGSLMRLSAAVTDDVQVGNVEFHVDGVLAFDDTTYPFEHRFFAPRRSVTKTTFTVRARAVDTGGNATWSTEYTITLLPDTVPPTVRAFLPAANTMNRTVTNVYVRFSELMNPATLTAPGFTLTAAGPDGVFDNEDDAPVPYFPVYRDTDSLARLALDVPLPPGLYRMRAAPPLADATGNAMAAPAESVFRVYDLTDTDNDGIPDDWESLLGTNPALADSNANGIADGLEDRDNDGTPDGVEIVRLGQDPRVADANSNGVADGQEDSDSDGMRDGLEAVRGTSIFNADTDGDGLDDSTEAASGLNPLVSSLSPTATALTPPTTVVNVTREVTPVLSANAESPPATMLNVAREVTPVLPANAESPPTTMLNVAREITPVIPTPVQSGPTSFRNNPPSQP